MFDDIGIEYQPSGARGTRSPSAMLQCLQNQKWSLWGPKMAEVSTSVFLGAPVNLCLISFLIRALLLFCRTTQYLESFVTIFSNLDMAVFQLFHGMQFSGAPYFGLKWRNPIPPPQSKKTIFMLHITSKGK